MDARFLVFFFFSFISFQTSKSRGSDKFEEQRREARSEGGREGRREEGGREKGGEEKRGEKRIERERQR